MLFEDCIERNFFTVMAQLTTWHIIDTPIANACPVGVLWKEYKLCAWIDELPDQPGACDAIYLNSFSGDPFHTETSLVSRSRIARVPILLISSLLWVT